MTIDPRRIELADYGVLHLAPRPGTNAAVMLGLAHVVARDGFVEPDFIDERTEGVRRGGGLLAHYTPERVEEITGIPAADIEAAAHIYAEATEAWVLWGLGVTEHKYGSEVVQLICNLAMMTGKVGRPGSALLPLRGQNNVQGSSDMGALPDTYTRTARSATRRWRAAFEDCLGRLALASEGLHDPADVRRGGRRRAEGDVHLRRGRRPDRPRHARTWPTRCESLEFLVCQDIFQNETTKYADVILPASAFLEKAGTFTNAERRFQLRGAGDRPAGRREDRPGDHHARLAGARARDGLWQSSSGRDGRDRGADPRIRRRQPRADRTSRAAVAGRRRRHRLADLYAERVRRSRAVAASSPRCPTSRPATPPTMSSR